MTDPISRRFWQTKEIPALVMLVSVAAASPASAQGPGDTWEFGLGPHVVRQNSTTHVGGGLTMARRYRTLAAVFEGSGTRRQGHNDWRLIGGPRLMLGSAGRSSLFAQALAGTLIRQRDADWAVLPGLGVDVQWTDSRAVRFQLDAPIERSESHTAKGIRASVWLTFR